MNLRNLNTIMSHTPAPFIYHSSPVSDGTDCRRIIDILLNNDNPWVRYILVPEFTGFPSDIARIIVDYLQLMQLRSWIPEYNLHMYNLAINQNAIITGMIDISDPPSSIVENPLAFDYIKQHIDAYLKYNHKWANPIMVELLFSINIYPIDYNALTCLGSCQSKLAVDWIINNCSKTDAILYLSRNPFAISFLKQNIDLTKRIGHQKIWANSAAVDILQSILIGNDHSDDDSGDDDRNDNRVNYNYDRINWQYLCLNSSEWAMNLLSVNLDKIHWDWLSENPSIFENVDNPNKEKLLEILSR